jgi:protocatechuate 3,4-dioxygenase beta subunit
VEVFEVPPPAYDPRLDDVAEWPRLPGITCDDDGAFVVRASPGSSIALRALSAGEASPLAIVHARDFPRGLELVVSPVAGFGLTVRNEQGAPIGSADVIVYEEALFSADPWTNGLHRLAARGRTDAEGRYRVPFAAVGPLEFVVASSGRGRVRESVDFPDREVEVVLRPGASLEGRVVDRSGAPVADAEVAAVLNGLTVDVTVTAPDGSYRLGRVPDVGPFEVEVAAPGRGCAARDQVKWAEGGRLDLVIEPVRAIRGRVLLYEPGRDLRPAAGVRLAGDSHPNTVVTGPDGGFVFEDHPLGSTVLGVLDPDLCTAQEAGQSDHTPAFFVGPTDDDLDLVIMRQMAEEGVLRVEQDREPSRERPVLPLWNKVVAGRVLGPLGEPIPFAAVQSLGDSGGPDRVTTDLRGRFRIEGCAPGLQRVTVRARGYRSRAFDEVPEGSEDLLLTLSRGESCSGRLLGPDGEPLPGLEVSAWPDSGGDDPFETRTEETRQSAVTGAQGEFTIAGLEPVPCCLRVTTGGAEYWQGPTLRKVPPGSTDLVLTARPTWFEMDIRIGGTVLDADGNAVIDAVVTAEPEGFRGRTLTRKSYGERGWFTVLGLWPGPHRITVTAKGYRTEIRRAVLCGTGSLEITLRH